MVTSELDLEVRYYETDLMGIVHHSNYIRYFECGRNKWIRDVGLPIEELEASGTTITNKKTGDVVCTGKVVLGFIHSDTRRPTRVPENLAVRLRPFFE